MTKTIVYMACLTAFVIVGLAPAWSNSNPQSSVMWQPIQEPKWVFVAGPGTVISVRYLDLPFLAPYYSVEFKTDDGQIIQIRQSAKDTPLLKGMRGTLTYSRHPESILSFRMAYEKSR